MSTRRRTGQPLTADEITAFWNKTTKASVKNDDCWEWTGLRQKIGGTNQVAYGVYLRPNNGEQLHAHRFAQMVALGAWDSIPVDPTGRGKRKMLVIHDCGNPLCCNPAHLVMGNYADKRRIMAKNGVATAKGWNGPRREYVFPTFEQAMIVWNGGISCKDAKEQWNLHPQTYYRYRNNKPDPKWVGVRQPDPGGLRKTANQKAYNLAYRKMRRGIRNDPKRGADVWQISKAFRVGRTAFVKRVMNPTRKR